MATTDTPIPTKKKKGKKKKKSSKKSSKILLAGDPPIIVGGGGSTLIWVHNDHTLTQIPLSDVNSGAPMPEHPENYQIFKLDVDITTSTVRINQSGGQSKHTGMDKKKFSTEFS
jgi:hypothetical protein